MAISNPRQDVQSNEKIMRSIHNERLNGMELICNLRIESFL